MSCVTNALKSGANAVEGILTTVRGAATSAANFGGGSKKSRGSKKSHRSKKSRGGKKSHRSKKSRKSKKSRRSKKSHRSMKKGGGVISTAMVPFGLLGLHANCS